MDNLTHTLSGLVLARLSKKSDESDPLSLKTGMIVATLATNMPDLDIVLAPFSSQLYLLHHRGETHSLLLPPLWARLLPWLFGKAFRHPGGWRPFYVLVALSLRFISCSTGSPAMAPGCLRFLTPGRDGPFLFGLCGPDWRVYRIGTDGLPKLSR